MCLLAIALGVHPGYPVVLIANRDEFHARPTAPLGAWSDPNGVIGGRDLQGGGTWLAIHRSGRIAALTNYREKPVSAAHYRQGQRPSRGALVVDYLCSDMPAKDWAASRDSRDRDYEGYSLIAGDVSGHFVCHSNRYRQQRIKQGVHALSNGELNSDWPKVQGLAAELAASLRDSAQLDEDGLFALLEDPALPADQLLPDTGVGLERERLLAPRFIASDDYGTRAATIVLVDADRQVAITERRYAAGGKAIGQSQCRVSPAKRVHWC